VTEPARWGRRRSVLDVFDRIGLARPAVRAYELALAARPALFGKDAREVDGLPLPPARLRAQVGPLHADATFFLESGKHNASLIRDLLRESGTSIDDIGSLLDWGCGCGRLLRHWANLTGTSVFGCDIDQRMVGWCNENLPFAEVALNELSPPLPYAESTFDLAYAFSVMTHLSEELQHSWMHECTRVLKPGGYLLISTLGEFYATRNRLTDEERRSFDDGNVVVLYERSAGSSLCSAYHPPEYVRRELASDLDYVAFRPAADDGRHDIHLLRKPTLGAAAR
jgi:SAM-dependent methyltransferase